MSKASRREILRYGITAGAGAALLADRSPAYSNQSTKPAAQPLKLGLVTYNLAKDWDVPTIIKNCSQTGFQGVELRTEHAHKVEIALPAADREEVKKRFADSPVKLAQLGGTYEFHSLDPTVVQKNIDGCKQYLQLAHDVGADAAKVRPNGLQVKAGVPVEKTLEQIGKALGQLGPVAADNGVELRVEVHGTGTSRVEYIQKIMEIANHPKVTVNWNSNQTDLEGGTLEENFNRVAKKIRHVHMRDLFVPEYPWQRLFGLLKGIDFQGYCCAEIPESADPLRVMRYYRALFIAYQG
jgi:sugar phosphate isomerase/epimerase